MQDNQIIALLQKRDEQALSEIRTAYGRLCFQIAEQMLGNPEDAEECVNETLLSVWNSIPPHEPYNLKSYLVVLLRRAATDQLRKNTRLKRGGAQVTQTLDELAEAIPAADNVEAEIDRKELTGALRRFLDAQPEQARQMFLERYYFAKPGQSIAETRGMHVGTVSVLLHRMRKKLKKHLEKEGFV